MAIVFWFTTRTIRFCASAARAAKSPTSAWLELEPLKNIQVWRFSLYYFFVFGAFVALSLWLPRYLIERLRPRHHDRRHDRRRLSRFRRACSAPMAVICPTATARAASCTGPSSSSVVCTFILSYPPTDYVVTGISGPITFHMEIGFVPFIVTVFVLGFFMSLGKAAVYKHIPVYYPKNVGSVGGLVGMIGGLGGFVLPIAFGALNDLTGVWTSCFMLLFVLVSGALLWMHLAIRQMERGVVGEALKKLPELPEMQEIHRPEHVGALSGAVLQDWRPEDKEFWEKDGRAIARRNLWISIPALLLSFAVWQVWSVVVAKLPSVGFNFTHRSTVLARGVARHFGRGAAHLLFVHGADLRRPAVDHGRDLVADDPGGRHRLCRAESEHALHRVPDLGAAVRPRRRQLRLVDGEHLLLLPEGRRRAMRSRSTPVSAISASASCSSWFRSRSPPACSAGSAANR